MIGLKCIEKKSNHESKNILESKLLLLTDKINLSIAEEALKVKVDEISLQLAIPLEHVTPTGKGIICCTNSLLSSFFLYLFMVKRNE